LIFAFLVFPLLALFPSLLGALLHFETNYKMKLQKGREIILKRIFIIEASNFFIFLYFPSISLSCKHVAFHLPFLLIAFAFIK